VIPAVPLEWFDQATRGVVLIFGDADRRGTLSWLEKRRSQSGGRHLRLDEEDATTALRLVRRWDLDTVFCDDCTDGAMVKSALEASAEGTLVVLGCESPTVVDGLQYLVRLMEHSESGPCLALLSRQIGIALSQRRVARADGNGAVGSFEVLRMTHAQRNFVRSDMIHGLSAQMAADMAEGGRWWPDALADLVLDGTCTIEAAEAAGHAPGEVERALGRR
jgi:Tfp pilus assembly pilus retraction ATPase PilT